MRDLRSLETHQKYLKFIADGNLSHGCNLCKTQPSIKEFVHWRIVPNPFPYDAVAKIHHMILPKRHVMYGELNEEEKMEYESLRWTYVEDNYDFVYQVVIKRQSIPEHFHTSLLVYHDPR
ncbi:hypothetical protein A2917_03630 [Candidatus Nomurabacteria bacterium RIFCSPLOWO2_01_FULL_42_17]|uniref:Uncharacterized protein n=1 Tax=Candidatus Nomurabacteria bacterium RIFCSPLOWO2_01_FULL_42_17 TaxID=1801780 RepID=A0A1F6XNF2_9BACT|nr:MAG: hypothetical protein A2917_03630 [Candidatus Nomurabacteria bacterium RIFCSPLOWO2_01_FULL_42_17]